MRNELFIKNFNADGAIAPYSIVRSGTNDGDAAQAVDGTVYTLGVADSLGADEAGEPTDVIMAGIATIRYAATIERDTPLMANADGHAIAATAGNFAVGYAAVSGVDGDLGAVEIVKHVVAA